MKILLLFLSLFTLSVADPIIVHDGFSSMSTVKQQITLEDTNATLCAEDILEERYAHPYPKHFTSYTDSVFWTKVTLKNGSNKQQRVIFRNPRAGIDKIDVHVYRGKTIKASYTLGDMRDKKLHPLSSVKSVFPLDLDPGEEVSVITRFESLGAMNLYWEISTPQRYSYTNIMEMIFYAAFGGIMLALIIYNLIMFVNLKENTFLFYTLHGICALWFQYAYNGMFYFLDTGINLKFLTISTWFVSALVIFFLILFTISFFKLREKNKNFYRLFTFFGAVLFLISLVWLYQLIDSRLIVFTLYLSAVIFIILLSTFLFAIYAVYNRYSGALYFLIGEGFYVIALIYVTFVIGGKSELLNSLQYTLVPIALLVEMIFLSMALSKRVGDIKRDNEFKSNLLIEEKKFVSVGKSIGNVTHQWKEPISQLSSQLMYLESLHHLKKEEILLSEFGSNIEQMNAVLEYMKGSVNDLYDFYSNSDHNGYFNLKKQIDMACKLQRDHCVLSHVDVTVDCPEALFVVGAKHALSNVLMILFDNALYAFTQSPAKSPKITIAVKPSGERVEVIFSDNAGGIPPQAIGKIFTSSYTTKGGEGCGLGLPLSKKLVEERLNGSISVANGEHGAQFTLILVRSPIGH